MPAQPVRVPPGYSFDVKSGWYIRQGATPVVVPRAEMLRVLDDHVGKAEQRLTSMFRRLHEGVASPGVSWKQAQRTLKDLYCQHSALGAGGWDRLGFRDFGRIGGRLRWEYERMERFVGEVYRGEVSEAQMMNRLHMYTGNARRLYYETEREHAIPINPAVQMLEMRTLGQAEHCASCVRYHEMGWQEMGVLPVPGDGSECDGNCRCSLERHETPIATAPEWIGTRRSR